MRQSSSRSKQQTGAWTLWSGFSTGSQQKALLQELQGKSRPCGTGNNPLKTAPPDRAQGSTSGGTHRVEDEDVSVMQDVGHHHLGGAEVRQRLIFTQVVYFG